MAQRVGPVSWVQSERVQRWLRAMNARKYNVFVSVNAIASGRRSRTRDAIGAVRHVFLDADHDGRAVLSRVEARRDLPSPSYILHSSPNHIHVFWRVSGFDPRRRRAVAEAACPRVADRSGSDAGDTEHSAARVLQPQASPATSRDDRVPQYEPTVRAGRFSTDRGRRIHGLNPWVRGEPSNFDAAGHRPSEAVPGLGAARDCRPARRRPYVSRLLPTRTRVRAGRGPGPTRAVASGTRDASRHGPRPSCSTSSVALLGTGASPSAGLL